MHVGRYNLIRGSNVIVIGFTSLKYEHVLLTLEGRCSSSYSYILAWNYSLMVVKITNFSQLVAWNYSLGITI